MGSVVVKTVDGAGGSDAALRRAVQEVVPGVPVSRVRTVEEYASGQVRDLRRASVLLSTFAVIAAALALIGIFGVVTHLVRQRSIELGIRMALGAAHRDVVSLVLRQGFTVIVIGIVLGTAGAFALLRVAQGLVYGVTTTDPLSYVGALAVLTVVGLLGCYLPARRASRIEPVVALRRD